MADVSGELDYPEVMTIEQTAVYLQLHPQVVYRHVRAGTLPASRIGRTIRFKRSVLDAFLERGAWVYANAFLNFVDAARKHPSSAANGHAQPAAVSRRLPELEMDVDLATTAPGKPFSADID